MFLATIARLYALLCHARDEMSEEQHVTTKHDHYKDFKDAGIWDTHQAGSTCRTTLKERVEKRRKYQQSEKHKKARRVYERLPQNVLKRKVYNSRPDVVKRHQAYYAREDIKERRRLNARFHRVVRSLLSILLLNNKLLIVCNNKQLLSLPPDRDKFLNFLIELHKKEDITCLPPNLVLKMENKRVKS